MRVVRHLPSYGMIMWLALLWLAGEGRASFYSAGVEASATLFASANEYLVQDSGLPVLGPFDPFRWPELGMNQPTNKKVKRDPGRGKPVTLVLSQGTEGPSWEYWVEPSSDFDYGTSGGSSRGTRDSQTELLPALATATMSTDSAAVSLPALATATISTDSATESLLASYGAGGATSDESDVVPTPLPPSVFLLGSGFLGLVGLKLAGSAVATRGREKSHRLGGKQIEWRNISSAVLLAEQPKKP